MSLATLADLKTYLGIGVGITTPDAELQRMLDMASKVVEQYVDRSLVSAARIERRNGYDTDVLMLRDTPITAVASLMIDTLPVTASDGTTPGYIFQDNSIFLIGGQVFTRGRKNIYVSYTGGYASNAIPADIVHSTIEIAAQAYREKEWIGFQSKTLAGETVAFTRGFLPDSAKIVLDLYRRMYPCD
jgi:hypothetical protein